MSEDHAYRPPQWDAAATEQWRAHTAALREGAVIKLFDRCIWCRGELGERWLYCSDECSEQSRTEVRQKRDAQLRSSARPTEDVPSTLFSGGAP